MEKTTHDPRSVAFSIRLYQALLQIYPSPFRQEYGWLMKQAFGDYCRRTFRHEGTAGLLPLWARTMLDTLATAIEEHTQRGIDMSKEKFIKLSGWAFVLGGLAFFLGWLSSSRPEYDPRNFYSLEIDRIANVVSAPLIMAALLLTSIGILGLQARFGGSSSGTGRFFLWIGAASGLVAFVAWGLETTRLFALGEAGWNLFLYSMTFMFTGLGLWGIECLRKRIMPSGHVLPLLAGIWMPLFILAGIIYESVTGSWMSLPEPVNMVLFGLITISLVGLGIRLQGEANPAAAPLPAD